MCIAAARELRVYKHGKKVANLECDVRSLLCERKSCGAAAQRVYAGPITC